MADEIRIVAKLDTTDVVNGVKRTEQAAREMKQVWDDSWASLQLEGPMEGKLWDDIPKVARTKGEESGKNFLDGFLGKLLLRDAIYGLISGATEALKTALGDINFAVGNTKPAEGIWAGIGHNIFEGVEAIAPELKDSQTATTQAEIAREESARNMDRIIRAGRDDPSSLQPTSSIENQLSGIMDQREAHQKDYDNKRLGYSEAGATANDMAGLKAAFEPQEKYFASMEASLKELLSMSKERDKKEGKSSAAKTDKTRRDEEEAMEHARAEERQDVVAKTKAAEHAKKLQDAEQKREDAKTKREAAEAARLKKNHQQHANAQTIQGDELAARGANTDLEFTRGQLDHQKATSAVRIGGGLFGRNDSAATLVQHAATQISLLRSIDNELKQTRQNQSELTLL